MSIMASHTNLLFFTLFFIPFLFSRPSSSCTLFDVQDFGADPTSALDSAQAFLDVWAAACSNGGFATIVVRRGSYFLSRPLKFGGPCISLHVSIKMRGATLVAPDYKVLGQASFWLSFDRVENVSVHGGVLDAKGPALWACKASPGSNCPDGATSLSLTNSNNIRIKDVMSKDSQMFHMTINKCHNVHIQGVRVQAQGNSPNTDGIHVQLSSNVRILRSHIATGDDCISIGPGTSNLWIEDIWCGPGHGISIGSLAWSMDEPGVQNVMVKNSFFVGTQNGLRIKSWARASNGFVDNVRFINAMMVEAQNPIIIDQHYCPHDSQTCPNQGSSVKISNVLYKGIQGTSASPVAVKFNCSAKNPCVGIRMKNVYLTCLDREVQSSCTNANGEASGIVQPSSCLCGET